VNGFFTRGNSISRPTATNNYTVRDLVTWTLGKHTFQFGRKFVLDKILTTTGALASAETLLSPKMLCRTSLSVPQAPQSRRVRPTPPPIPLQPPVSFKTTIAPAASSHSPWVAYDVQTPPTDSIDRVSAYGLDNSPQCVLMLQSVGSFPTIRALSVELPQRATPISPDALGSGQIQLLVPDSAASRSSRS
jgi:hypothetical protein